VVRSRPRRAARHHLDLSKSSDTWDRLSWYILNGNGACQTKLATQRGALIHAA
jgi:hypothetical protein